MMRFIQYKEILKKFDSIIEMTENMISINKLQLSDIYIDTLESILSILKSEEKYKNLVSLINDVIELISVKYNDLEVIQSLIYRIYNEIRESLGYKIKVLFVAELSSKWDSMESVYYSFINKEDVHVDILIQPIFREEIANGIKVKNEILYDYLTDKGINHIPYKEYDFELEKPDIIFYSQPYETVTERKFWPVEMSKYGRLVYLPYYASTIINNSISHDIEMLFSYTNKIVWKNVCQSETMKNIYMKNGINGDESKYLVTGIPKWDYPIKLNKDNTLCPKEWREKINNRVVFLWNTHYHPNCQGLEIFSKGISFLKYIMSRNDIALIWRPHPMTESILEIYYPEWYLVYKKLVSFVGKSDNIILDMTDDYSCSFVWSDALISDYSSIADQYLFMDKPFVFTSYLSVEDMTEEFSYSFGLYDFSKVDFINTTEGAEWFINKVVENPNYGKEERKYLRDNFFSLADGKVGSRLTDLIIEELKKEINQELKK